MITETGRIAEMLCAPFFCVKSKTIVSKTDYSFYYLNNRHNLSPQKRET